MVRASKDFRPPNVAGKAGEVPIGGVLFWYKATIGVGSLLPDGYVECNGQVLSDPESPLTGNTIPDINGSVSSQANFIRAATTAAAARAGNLDGATSVPATTLLSSTSQAVQTSGTNFLTGVSVSNSGAATQGAILPSYFQLVAIMRVR